MRMLLALLLGSALLQQSLTLQAAECQLKLAEAAARQEIEYLRRWYARSTDLIGKGTPESVAEGRAIYQRIFTPEAQLYAGDDGVVHRGPDAWAKLVFDALAELGPTQHLIGTQLVEFDALEFDAACNVTSGKATMQSYVQAWHDLPDQQVWLFLGTYHDKVVYSATSGWQIEHMHLRQTSAEVRVRGHAPGSAPEA